MSMVERKCAGMAAQGCSTLPIIFVIASAFRLFATPNSDTVGTRNE